MRKSKSHTMQRRDAVKYGRVSSREQEKEGFSIPAQFKLLDQYAKSQGLKVVREFVDVETAKKPGRAGFEEMIKSAGRTRTYNPSVNSRIQRWRSRVPDKPTQHFS